MKKYLILFLIPLLALFPSINLNAEGSSYIDAYGIGYENFYLYDYPYLDSDYYVCMTTDQYQSSSIYDSSVASRMVQMQSLSTLDTYIWNHQDISNEYFINVLKTSIPADISPSEYPYFIIQKSATDMSDNVFDVYFLSENANLICFSSYGFVSSEDGSDLKLSAYTYSNGNYTEKGGYTNPVESSVVGIGTMFYVYYSNMPILVSDTSFSNFYDGISYFRTNPENFVDQNYLLYDAQGNPNYSNPNIGGGGSSGENASNNLYMQNPNWQFKNIPSFGTILDSNSKGQAVFSAQLTDYQKDNLNNFRLDFTFNTYWNGETYSIGSDDVTPVKHNFSKSFLYQVQVPLSDFYSSGSMYSIYIDDIFKNSVSSDTDQTLEDFGNSYKIQYMMNTNNFRTSFSVNLIALDNSGESGSCTAYYSYKTGTSQTTNNSMGINTNPYVDDDGSASGVTDPTDDSSGNGSGNGVSNVGDGSIVNNNNPTININNNNALTSDGDSNGLLSTLLLMIFNNQTATSEGLAQVADTSGYVEVCGDVFQAIPATWWTTLTAAFVACIGILVISFAIKIILNIVT